LLRVRSFCEKRKNDKNYNFEQNKKGKFKKVISIGFLKDYILE